MNKYLLFAVLLLAACKDTRKEQFVYEPSIASIINGEELKYVDYKLQFYSTLSATAKELYEESIKLDWQTQAFKEKILRGEVIGMFEQNSFFDDFRKTFKESKYVDYDQWEKLKAIRMRTVADVDLVKKFIKTSYFYIVNDEKILPFTAFGINACSNVCEIKEGEPFTCDLSVNAYNTSRPFEWYVVKSLSGSLTKSNIIDTLKQDEEGRIQYSTTRYKKGENSISFVCNVKSYHGDNVVGRTVDFVVK